MHTSFSFQHILLQRILRLLLLLFIMFNRPAVFWISSKIHFRQGLPKANMVDLWRRFLDVGCPLHRPTNSLKALKGFCLGLHFGTFIRQSVFSLDQVGFRFRIRIKADVAIIVLICRQRTKNCGIGLVSDEGDRSWTFACRSNFLDSTQSQHK